MTISILDVGPMQCRYIEGNDHMCCGASTVSGSWCPEHHAIVFKPDSRGRDVARPYFAAELRKKNIPTILTLAGIAEAAE